MQKIKAFFDKDARFLFVFTVGLMLITHGFNFTNLMFSHDSLYFYDLSISSKVDFGRWLYPFCLLTRNIATPWMLGVISTIYVAISVVLVSKTLRFDRIKGMCVSGLFVTNISLIALYSTYFFDADADCLALVLACFAVYSFDRCTGKQKKILPVVSIVCCLALYQAYIGVTVGLFLILLMYKASECKTDEDVSVVFKTGRTVIFILLISGIIYGVLMIITAIIYGVGLSSGYNGPGNLSSMGIKGLLIGIPKAYGYFFKRLIWPDTLNNGFVLVATAVLFFMSLYSFILYIKNRMTFNKSLKVIIPAIILLPLGLNSIYIVSQGVIHQLMIFAYSFAFLLPLIISELIFVSCDEKIDEKTEIAIHRIKIISIGAILIISFNHFVFANGVYTYRKLVYDNTIIHAQEIWKDVNSLEGYVEGETPVVFVGSFIDSKASYHSDIADRYAESLLGGVNTSSITYESTIERFYSGILGRDMVVEPYIVDDYNAQEISKMPTYPTLGYCKMDSGKVIVKMSEVAEY